MTSFRSLYAHGFVRIAATAPKIAPADPAANAAEMIALARKADEAQAALLVFPELGLSGYAIDDLLLQDALQQAVLAGLEKLVAASAKLFPTLIVGAPLMNEGALYNCAVVIHRGEILGVVPKSFLPNYREFYEKRFFAAASHATSDTIELLGETIPFGADLIFAAEDYPGYAIGVEICEDVWAPTPPSTSLALSGATVLANLSASNIVIGKAEDRNLLCRAQAQRCVAAYLYSAAGFGESATDLAWDGHLAVFEMGEKLAESERFATESVMIAADVDVGRLVQERARFGTFRDAGRLHPAEVRTIPFALERPKKEVRLSRVIPRFPFVPAEAARLDRDCYEAYNIQVSALMTRMKSARIEKAVIGVSGGLDSTQALLVICRALDLMNLPRNNCIAVTMPGFATSAETKKTAHDLMDALGVDKREIDIKPLATQILADIGHPYAHGEKVYDVTFENVQAGARTDLLFRLANKESALVIGTADLSELALGWATYGVGDHMSHYAVNASVAKTLIQHLIRWVSARDWFGQPTSDALDRVLATEISPELVPAENGEVQSTQAKIGPYALQDFTLYYLTRYGLAPSKIAFMALEAWEDSARGPWPANIAASERAAYDLPTIKKWMEVFLTRFFAQSQFKRTAVPNGPKLTSGGSLSPRGDWRAPSDSSAAPWLDELKANVP